MKKLLIATLLMASTSSFAQVIDIKHKIVDRRLGWQEGWVSAGSSTYLYNESGGTEHYTVHMVVCVDTYGCSKDSFKEWYLKPGESKRIDQGASHYVRFRTPEARTYWANTWTHKGTEVIHKSTSAMVEAY